MEKTIKDRDGVLTITLEEARKVNRRERAAVVILGATAALGFFLPHFTRMTKFTTAWSLGTGIFGAAGYTYLCATRKRKEQITHALDQGELLTTKKNLTSLITRETIGHEMEHTHELLDDILLLPEPRRSFWLQKYNLTPLVPPQYNPEIEYEALEASPPLVSVNQSSFEEVKDKGREIDYSWIDHDFMIQSKAIIGAMGSGKSWMLYMIAKYFITAVPGGELRISDKHFDMEESKWLLGVPPELVRKKYVVKSVQDTVEMFRYVHRELLKRIDQENRKGHPIMFICDEFIAFMAQVKRQDKLDKTNVYEEIMGYIQDLNFEARKYLVFITLGLHSAKKEISGLDSSVMDNFYCLYLADTIADATLKLSRSFNLEELMSDKLQVTNFLKEGEGFAAVYKPRNGTPRVVVVPHITDNDIRVIYQESPQENPAETPEENPHNVASIMMSWFIENPSATREAIAAKWLELTGDSLTDEGLTYLIETLRTKSL